MIPRKIIELLVRDLSCRIPYGVIVTNDGSFNVKLTSVSWYGEVGVDDGSTYLYPIAKIKPYLFPFSSITETQKEEYAQILAMSSNPAYSQLLGMTVEDWLNKNHIDYRGLIPMGLANDATGLNIY